MARLSVVRIVDLFTPAPSSLLRSMIQFICMAPKGPVDSFDLQDAGNIRFSRLAQIVRQYVMLGPFLDLGCGTGGFLDAINDNRGLGFEVGQLGRRQSTKGFQIITGNFFDLQGQDPFTDEAFSFITAFDVFEHLPDLPRYLEQSTSFDSN